MQKRILQEGKHLEIVENNPVADLLYMEALGVTAVEMYPFFSMGKIDDFQVAHFLKEKE